MTVYPIVPVYRYLKIIARCKKKSVVINFSGVLITRLYQLSYQIIDTFNTQTQNNKIIKTFIINNSKNYMLYVKDSQSHPSMLNFQP
jgi:hypothetical protein